MPSLEHPTAIELDRFMGKWYVHGYTPLLIDKEAYNATEVYELQPAGRIHTTYQFRKGGFDGPLKTYTPVGFVYDHENKTEWRMQFIWPFKSRYVIMHVDPDYRETIIVHPNRKYAWIMTRSAVRDDEQYRNLLGMLKQGGFDMDRIQQVPHQVD